MYYQRLPDKDAGDDSTLVSLFKDDQLEEDNNISALYVFADKYNVPALMKLTLDQMFKLQYNFSETGDHLRKLPSDETVELLFTHLQGSSPTKQLRVGLHCYFDIGIEWNEEPDSLPRSFLHACLKRFNSQLT